MFYRPIQALIFVCLASVAIQTQASQFYVFPVKELEGVSNSISAEKRPLIDPRVRELISPEVQTTILELFAQKIATAFSSSVVHARQVRNSLGGGAYKYINNDSLTCGEGFTVPVKKSYAAVIGLTRASWYQESHPVSGNVGLQIPITLNLQLIKPETAKVVYSVSQTLYSPFKFDSVRALNESKSGLVKNTLIEGINQQIDGLVKELQTGFKPKEAVVKIAGRSNGVLVTNKGFEVGFVAGDMPLAVNQKTKKEVIFQVLSVDSGYSVVKLAEGDASVGDEFIFQFESEANDSRKPRVMPVTSQKNLLTSAIADLFSKDIGFKADFQIAAVDVNFKDTQDSIERKANCAPWEKFASVRKDLESRVDYPDYFLRFDHGQSPVTNESSVGHETRDSFATAVGVQLVDLNGNVLFAELGNDFARLDKVAGKGLAIENAIEVSIKNATSAAAKKFVTNVKFQPANFEISAANKTSFVVQGLSFPEGTTIAYDVLRPLSVEVDGKKTFWRLTLGEGQQAPQTDGSKTTFQYSALDTEVQRGDRLVISNMPKKGQTRLSECAAHYVAPGSQTADYLLPLIRHAAFVGQKTQLSLSSPDFFKDANFLLQEGKFKLKVQPNTMSEVCVRPGYALKPTTAKCDGASCNVDALTAITIIHEKGDQRVANFVQAETISLKGVAQPQIASFVGYKAFESVMRNLPKLTEKLNTAK